MGSNIVETIRQKYPAMTRKQKSIADFMLADPDSMAFMTLKELSEKTNVSETTILHTCTALELSNYNELKYEFRKYLNERTKTEVQQQEEERPSEWSELTGLLRQMQEDTAEQKKYARRQYRLMQVCTGIFGCLLAVVLVAGLVLYPKINALMGQSEAVLTRLRWNARKS